MDEPVHRKSRNPFRFLYYLLRSVLAARHLVFVVLSPFLLICDLFRFRGSPRRDWLLYFIVFFFIFLSLTGAIVLSTNSQINEVMNTISTYHQLKFQVSDDIPYGELINIYAVKNDLEPLLVAAVIKQESQFQYDALSSRGARGLMQIRPLTWQELNPDSECSGKHGPFVKGEDCIFHPEANIRYGTIYLSQLLKHFEGDLILALSAYNAGYGNIFRYRERTVMGGIPPFQETQNYVREVVRYWQQFRRDALLENYYWNGPLEFGVMLSGYLLKDYLLAASLFWFFLLSLWLLRRIV